MNIATLYIKLMLLVVLPLIIGIYFSKYKYSRLIASKLFAIALYLCQTIIVILAVWTAQLQNGSWMLPFIVLAGFLLSIAVALIAEKWLKHDTKKEEGSFIFTICLSNNGYTLQGIITLMVFGELGLAQATYAQFLVIPFLTLVCFPMARSYGGMKVDGNIGSFLLKNVFDKRNIPLVAMLIGLALNFSRIQRPDFCSHIVDATVYIGTLISGIAVGLLFSGSHIFKYIKENIFSFIYRSSLYPLFFIAVSMLLGLNKLDTFVLILFGITPSAIFSNLIADFFKLDKDLTNSVYIISTTLFLLIALPIYLFIVNLMF